MCKPVGRTPSQKSLDENDNAGCESSAPLRKLSAVVDQIVDGKGNVVVEIVRQCQSLIGGDGDDEQQLRSFVHEIGAAEELRWLRRAVAQRSFDRSDYDGIIVFGQAAKVVYCATDDGEVPAGLAGSAPTLLHNGIAHQRVLERLGFASDACKLPVAVVPHFSSFAFATDDAERYARALLPTVSLLAYMAVAARAPQQSQHQRSGAMLFADSDALLQRIRRLVDLLQPHRKGRVLRDLGQGPPSLADVRRSPPPYGLSVADVAAMHRHRLLVDAAVMTLRRYDFVELALRLFGVGKHAQRLDTLGDSGNDDPLFGLFGRMSLLEIAVRADSGQNLRRAEWQIARARWSKLTIRRALRGLHVNRAAAQACAADLQLPVDTVFTDWHLRAHVSMWSAAAFLNRIGAHKNLHKPRVAASDGGSGEQLAAASAVARDDAARDDAALRADVAALAAAGADRARRSASVTAAVDDAAEKESAVRSPDFVRSTLEIENMKRTAKNMTREVLTYVGRHLPQTDTLVPSVVTEYNSTALSSTTGTSTVMFFAHNRRKFVILTTAAGAHLQHAGGALARRKHLTLSEYRQHRAKDGVVQLFVVPRDVHAAINIGRQERMSAYGRPLPGSMRSSGSRAMVDEFVRADCDVARFAARLVALAGDAGERQRLGLPSCSLRWLAKQLRGVTSATWSLDDSDVIEELRSADRQYADAHWAHAMPKPRALTEPAD